MKANTESSKEANFGLKTLLAENSNLLAGAGVAEWLSRQPRDQTMGHQIKNWQDSWWASCSQGFESLPRRHQHLFGQILGVFIKLVF